jgi:hypothetical protein
VDLFLGVSLEHALSFLAGADSDRLLHRQDEDLATFDLT